MSRLKFKLESRSEGTGARAGRLFTRRGEMETPVFMPVGTRATVRGIPFDVLAAVGAKVMLANAYHLRLQPGPEVFAAAGGIHAFTGWDGAVLTDSGGYQVFSLSEGTVIGDDGVQFTHPRTREKIHLSAALSIEIQRAIGSDIMMAFDECVPATADFETARQAVTLSTREAARSSTRTIPPTMRPDNSM